MSVDPVSGNDIPPGGTAEGVRDDINIKVSGGEYIFTEAEVKFIGLDKLEKMSQSANAKLKEMEEAGRIGGEQEELPLGDDIEKAFAEGGLVGDTENVKRLVARVRDAVESDPNLKLVLRNKGLTFADGGLVDQLPKPTFNPDLFRIPGQTYFNFDNTSSASATDVRIYEDKFGNKISISFKDGEPVNTIPVGFFPEGHTFPTKRKPQGERPDGVSQVPDRHPMSEWTNDELMAVTDQKSFSETGLGEFLDKMGLGGIGAVKIADFLVNIDNRAAQRELDRRTNSGSTSSPSVRTPSTSTEKRENPKANKSGQERDRNIQQGGGSGIMSRTTPTSSNTVSKSPSVTGGFGNNSKKGSPGGSSLSIFKHGGMVEKKGLAYPRK